MHPPFVTCDKLPKKAYKLRSISHTRSEGEGSSEIAILKREKKREIFTHDRVCAGKRLKRFDPTTHSTGLITCRTGELPSQWNALCQKFDKKFSKYHSDFIFCDTEREVKKKKIDRRAIETFKVKSQQNRCCFFSLFVVSCVLSW